MMRGRMLMALGILVFGDYRAQAQTRTLQGLTTVEVQTLIDGEVLAARIQHDVEVKLRVAGLSILPTTPRSLFENTPRLVISTNSVDIGFIVIVAFSEPAVLERDPQHHVQAITWARQGFSSTLDYNGGLGRFIKDLVDEFISDWIIANPRQH